MLTDLFCCNNVTNIDIHDKHGYYSYMSIKNQSYKSRIFFIQLITSTMNKTDMWTLLELPRIIELYEDEYIIYDVSDWNDEDVVKAYNMLMNSVEYDGSSVKKINNNNSSIIVRYPIGVTPKEIHVLTRSQGTKITIPEGKNIEDFIKMYLE